MTETNKIKKYTKILAVLGISLMLVAGLNFSYAQTLDTVEPSDVENVKTVPGDSEVTLTWDSATDNVEVAGYKIYRGTHPVKNMNDSYDLPTIPVGDVTSYIVKNLTNDQTYYFTVTAMDSAGNESQNYSIEVNATPAAGLKSAAIEDDGKAPEVKDVEAKNNVTVKVEFSEPIKLPIEQPVSAFKIEKTSDKSQLNIQLAEIDTEDTTGATILLTTDKQETDAEYVVTAGIEIQDFFDNPIISGVSDTGSFKGSSKDKVNGEAREGGLGQKELLVADLGSQPQGTSDDKTPPSVVTAVADYNNRISITFSEKIVLPENPKSKISVSKKGTAALLNVVNVSLSVDEKTLYILTDPQEVIEYEVKISEIKDAAGNLLPAESGTLKVTGMGPSIKDLIPPEDVTALIAKIKDSQKNIAELSWKASKNSAGDLTDQIFYQSEGKNSKTFKTGTPIGALNQSLEIQDLQSGKWYTFKVSTKDTSGNESKGAITSLYLPKTGPGIVVAGLTALIMGWYRKKKKNKYE